MIEQYTIGSDPEGFVFDNENGIFVPSVGLIGGDKHQPKPFGDGFAMLEDNVMVEYNIPPSAFGENLKDSIAFATKHIEENVLPDNHSIKYQPTAVFAPEQLQTPKAMEFGCEPDMDVYAGGERDSSMITEVLMQSTIRFSGGHVHFGYDNPDIDVSVELVRLFDLFLGVPSVLMDTDQERRNAYGQPGAFRFKPYGFEYRTLSNFWVNNHEDLVTAQINQAVSALNDKMNIDDDIPNVIHAIKTGDADEAKSLIEKYNIHV